MDRLRHAHLARELIGACGGLAAAKAACRVGTTQLSDYQSPHGEGFMPADVVADLEAYCGRAVYSRALFEAAPDQAPTVGLKDTIAETFEHAADFQRELRLATVDGSPISPAERARLLKRAAPLEDDVRDLVAALSLGGG